MSTYKTSGLYSPGYVDAFPISGAFPSGVTTVKGIWVGTAGTLTLTTLGGNSVTFTAPAGLLPIAATAVTAGSASNLVGLL